MSKHVFSMLCLGDSYTIGEGVPLHESFPYQTIQLLRKEGHGFHAPEIVAQSGWTTFELAEYLIHHSFEIHYDFVTLLIGANNQYRSLLLKDYEEELEYLLKKAIGFCTAQGKQVFVMTIPDWSITPFAKEKKREKEGSEIDRFNESVNRLVQKYGVQLIDIQPTNKNVGDKAEMLAVDGLHPSGKMYKLWSALLFEAIENHI